MAITFSTSKPFRRAIYTNYLLCTLIVLEMAYILYLILGPDAWSKNLFLVFLY